MPDLAHPDPGTWTFDPAHTTIEFVARHLMVAKVRGGFAGFTGSLEIAENPTDSKVTIEVDVASVDSEPPTETTTSVRPTSSMSKIIQP